MMSTTTRTKYRCAVIVVALLSLMLSSMPLMAEEPPEPVGVRSNQFLDEFYDDTRGNGTGGVNITDGFLTLDNLVWTDDFNRANIDPWRYEDVSGLGTVEILNGVKIRLTAGPTERIRATRSVDMVDLKIEARVKINVSSTAGPGFEFRTDAGTGYTVDYWRGNNPPGFQHAFRIMKGFPGEGGQNAKYAPWHIIPVLKWIDMEASVNRDGTISFTLAGQTESVPDCYFDGNITSISLQTGIGGQVLFDDVKVRRSYFDGEFVSERVHLPHGMVWDGFEEDSVSDYSQLLRLDILDGKTGEPVPGYEGIGSMNLMGIDPVRHPSLRLRAWLATMGYTLPVLDYWRLTWGEGSRDWMDPFDDGDNVTTTGTATVSGGGARTPNVVLDEDFRRLDMDPWQGPSRDCEIRTFGLWTESGGKALRQLLEFKEFTLEAMVTLKAIQIGGPRIELMTTDTHRLSIGFDNSSQEFYITYHGETEVPLGRQGGSFVKYDTLSVRVVYEDGRLSAAFGEVFINATWTAGPTFDAVRLSSSLGGLSVWHNISIVTPVENGTVTTAPFSPPVGQSWHSLEVHKMSPPGSSLNISLLDGRTGAPVGNFTDIAEGLTDLTDIFVTDQPSLKVRIELTGVDRSVPSVDWYRVNWEPLDDTIVQVKPFDNITIEEDADPEVQYDLTEHFKSRLTPSDKLTFSTVEWADTQNLTPTWDGHNFSVTIRTADWNGETTFRFKCHNSQLAAYSETIRIIVLPEDDAPSVSTMTRFTVTEGEDSPVELGPLLSDVDTPVHLLTLATEEANCSVSGLILTFNFPVGGFDLDVMVTVMDGNNSVNFTVPLRVTDVNDPPVIGAKVVNPKMEESPFSIDLSDVISDEETGDEGLTLTCDHPAVTDVDGLVLTLLFEYSGDALEVPFTVSDGFNEVQSVLVLTILRWNDPPTSIDLPPTVEIDEGGTWTQTMVVEDEDDDEHEIIAEPQSTEIVAGVTGYELVIDAFKGKVGTFTLAVTAFDPEGKAYTHWMNVTVLNVNDPPSRPTFTTPLNHTSFRKDQEVNFTVDVDDPDIRFGDVLWVNISSDVAGKIASLTYPGDLTHQTKDLPPGKHVITVTVTDGQYERVAWLEVTVKEESDPGPEYLMWGIVILLLIVIIALVFTIGSRLGRAPEPEAAPEEGPDGPEGEPVEPEDGTSDERSDQVARVQHILMDMPDGLPAELWGRDISDLAEAIVDGESRELDDGSRAVRINGGWYRADVDDPNAFLEKVEMDG